MDINQFLASLRDKLLRKDNWQEVVMSRQWTSSIPSEAGVYVFSENGQIVYVGETGNLQGRMNDLLDSRHHTVRRTIGERLFSKHDGFKKATTKNKFPDHIERLVNDHICCNLRMAFLVVPLGRKELEEFIETNIPKELRLNKRGKRITR